MLQRRVFRVRAPWVHHVLSTFPLPYRSFSFSLRFSGLLYPLRVSVGPRSRWKWAHSMATGTTPDQHILAAEICKSVKPETDRRRRVSVCSPIAADDSRNEETSVWPSPRRNARPGPRAPDWDPERVSLSLSLSLSFSFSYSTPRSPKWYVFSVPHRACPFVPFPRTSRHRRRRRRLLYSHVSERGWIGAMKNECLTRRNCATLAIRWWCRCTARTRLLGEMCSFVIFRWYYNSVKKLYFIKIHHIINILINIYNVI